MAGRPIALLCIGSDQRANVERPPINFPEVLQTPTGWLLPAAVLYSKTALDTGGGVTSDNRVGLGDVAEFGVASTDQVRERIASTDKPERIQPYITASFRMGVAEHRLFDSQPGVTLGQEKQLVLSQALLQGRSYEANTVDVQNALDQAESDRDGRDCGRLAADRRPDAATGDVQRPRSRCTTKSSLRQLRVFGGFEARPLPKSAILIDLGWAPEFCYQCTNDTDKIKLRPELSWGVRYEVASFMHIESGVRVPDIGNFNLLDAQIFGQITFTSFALQSAVESLK
jgi:hypothetical protein